MKSIKVIVIGFILAIALVVWPVEYMQYITVGIGFLLAAVLMAWLGVHRRKSAQKEYEDDVRRYTGTTMMKVVWIEESADERWEHQKDGSDRLRRETVYLPTYEYAVNGRTYQYASRQALSSKRDLGRQVVGYYDPDRPDHITENRPPKTCPGRIPVLLRSSNPAVFRDHDIYRSGRLFLMPGMYNHCDQGYSSGTTVCAVERNNKKIEAKSEGTQNAFAFLLLFCTPETVS